MADQNEDELRNMAINLVSMLRRSLTNLESNVQGQSTPQESSARGVREGTSQESPGLNRVSVPAQAASTSAVQQNLARSFPGLFRDRQNCRRFSQFSKKRPGTRTAPVQFFLLHGWMEKTPKTSEELMLLQAGLGKRTIHVPEDAGHKEITDLLCAAYPKMSNLDGGWMFYKPIGGSGQRKLNLLTPEEKGYTGASLMKTGGGKSCIYIMPIQHTLDISPLPYTAPEFQAMPKARCVSCQEYVPLQLLSLHDKTCAPSEVKNESPSDDDIITLDDEVASNDAQPSFSKTKVSCPLCSQLFTEEDICIHASVCGESKINEEHADDCDTTEHFSSISDILKSLEKKVDRSKTFIINVTREDLFQRGLKQWTRQKHASPQNLLRVSFIGENGIDDGALRKEFLTEMVRGIETHLFEGDEKTGKSPKYSICDYQGNTFRTCGEILATSLVQGGPAPNFLSRWCYNFLCHGKMDKDGGPDEVSNQDIKNLMRVSRLLLLANEDQLLELSDTIVACGYTGPLHLDRKNAIIDAIAVHSLVRLIPILNQLREGFKLYGLDEMLAHHHQMCQQLFVPGYLMEVDTNFLLHALAPEFSEMGSIRRQREMRVINFLQDYLQKLEDRADNQEGSPVGQGHVAAVPATTGGAMRLTVQSFLQWVSGQAHVPLIESDREAFKIMVTFDHDCDSRYGAHSVCYPIVNACAVAITLPTRHLATYQEFEDNLTEAISGGYEFSRH